MSARRGKSRLPLRVLEVAALMTSVVMACLQLGAITSGESRSGWVSLTLIVSLALMTFARVSRLPAGGLVQPRWQQWNAVGLTGPLAWLLGMFFGAMYGFVGASGSPFVMICRVSEIAAALLGLTVFLNLWRSLIQQTRNSSVPLIASFAVLVLIGTALLMLPVCRAGDTGSAPWHVALFTSVSAGCVTGLIVVPTGSYWSPTGQAVIFLLFQTGGLGILTFGAFHALLIGRGDFRIREAESLREMLDTESLRSTRSLLTTILLFTLCTELAGGVLLLNLQTEGPFGSRLWYGLFHSVSAFCNAGFSLNDDGLLGMEYRWQVWGAICGLILLGGIGFPVIRDLASRLPAVLSGFSTKQPWHERPSPPRLTIHTRLVLITTGVLLLGGFIGVLSLESLREDGFGEDPVRSVATAWFRTVTFRTAGFNTTDQGQMHPATKLFAVGLMYIGASPGSTGGGVKTVTVALVLLSFVGVFRGRKSVEIFHRTIPFDQIGRAQAVFASGIAILMAATLMMVVFEGAPEKLIDHLYEVTSAFATVGVSTGITSELTLPSQLLLIVLMFIGRVGPMTLLLALAGRGDSDRYDYPEERITLG